VAARWTERLHYRLATGLAVPLLPLVSGSVTLNHALGVRGHS
jgi:hypothetical protein